MTLYCGECGQPTQYSGTRPKFCCSCATPFDKTAANLAKAARAKEESTAYEEPPVERPKRPSTGTGSTARRVTPSYEPKETCNDEIPTEFGITAIGEAPQKLTVASLRSQADFVACRPELGGDALAAKNEALKNMLSPQTPQRNAPNEA